MMLIKDVQRKSLTLKNVLRYRCDTDDSKDMFRYVKDWLLYHQISLSDAYVEVEHGRSEKDDSLLDIELLIPVNASRDNITHDKFEFLPSCTFNDVVSVYYRGLRLYKRALSRLSEYMKVNNLQPISSVCSRIYHQEDGVDIAAELFVCVEERSIPRDPDMKLTAREKQACFDRAVKQLENKLSEKELCESVYSMSILDINEGIVSLAVENDLILEIVRTKYIPMIEDAFRTVLNMPVALYLTVEDEEYDDDGHEEEIADAERIFDIMDANRKAYLQHSADMLADELINLPCEYSDKTTFVNGFPFYSDEEKDRIYTDALKYLDSRMDPDVMKEFVDILSVKYIDKERVILSVPKLHVHKTHKIRMTYLPALTNAFRYAMNGNIEVEIVEE